MAARGLGAQHPVRVRPDRAALGARQPDRSVPQQQGQHSTIQYSTVQIVQFLSSMVRTVQYSAVQYSTWSEQCSNSNYNCKLSNYYVELDRYQLQTLPN